MSGLSLSPVQPASSGDAGGSRLQQAWTMWRGCYGRGASELTPIGSFDSVAGFWATEERLGRVALPDANGHDFYLFKAGQIPQWEAPEQRLSLFLTAPVT